jgi:hypothetical protein
MTISGTPEVDEQFRPLDTQFICDPYEALNQLREAHPIHQMTKVFGC